MEFEVKAIMKGFGWKGDYVERFTPALIHLRTSGQTVDSWTWIISLQRYFSCQRKWNKSLEEIVFLISEDWFPIVLENTFFPSRHKQNSFMVFKDVSHPFYWFCSHLFFWQVLSAKKIKLTDWNQFEFSVISVKTKIEHTRLFIDSKLVANEKMAALKCFVYNKATRHIYL